MGGQAGRQVLLCRKVFYLQERQLERDGPEQEKQREWQARHVLLSLYSVIEHYCTH